MSLLVGCSVLIGDAESNIVVTGCPVPMRGVRIIGAGSISKAPAMARDLSIGIAAFAGIERAGESIAARGERGRWDLVWRWRLLRPYLSALTILRSLVVRHGEGDG